MGIEKVSALPRLRAAIYTLFVLIISLSHSNGQEISFSHLTTANGLSQNNISAILKDSKGFMWFGTDDGLNRYDGYEFIFYHNSPTDSSSISSNAITCLFQDSENRLWIGTKCGLNLYDRETNTFKGFYADDGEYVNLIKTISEDDDKRLWVGTNNGLRVIDPISHKLIQVIPGKKDRFNLNNTSIKRIVFDQQLWIATDSGLVNFNVKENQFTLYKPFPEHAVKNGLNSICIDKNKIWLGTYENGLFLFDRSNKTFSNYRHDDKNANTIISNEVDETLVVGGKLWICTPRGVSILNPKNGNFQRLQHDKHVPTSLSFNNITEIILDNQGIVWLGSRTGVNIYSGNADKFIHFKHNINSKEGLSENSICAITENADGHILIATDGGGLNVFNPITKQFTNIVHEPGNKNSLSSNKVLAVLNDSEGGLWMGTWGEGINYYNPKSKRYLNFKNDPNNKNSLSTNKIFYLYEDTDGDIWICTWDGGLCKFDKKTKRITPFPLNKSKLPESSGNTIALITAYQDKKGMLWFGSQEMGVYRYDKKSDVLTKFVHDRQNPTSISLNNANVIFEDSKNRLWFGTDGGGLNLFNRKTETFAHFRVTDGLPDDGILGILEDDTGHLWISTNHGLAKIKVTGTDDKAKLEIKVYDKSDGLQDNQFNCWAYYKSKMGYMFFGGNNGFNMFHPDSIKINTFIPPLVVTAFSLFNKPVTSLDAESSLSKNITETNSIKINYDQSMISFDFVALNYIHPEKNQYAYFLKNFDDRWNYVGNQRKATYTNLDPGEYEFIVRGSNNDDVWNKKGTSIKLIVLPPYWQTFWFKGIVVITFLLFIYLLYRIRINYLIHQKYELARQVKQRTLELEESNIELTDKIEVIKTQNEILNVQKTEIAGKNNEIQAQNEELTTQKDHINYQREELEKAQQKLRRINERLEILVSHRTKKLRLTIKELDKTVMELDRFVYSASHDLSAPLKSIRGLVHIGKLEKDYTRVSEYYHYIENSILKLEKVIQSMVEFSRNTNLEVKSESINLHHLVNEVISTLTFWQGASKIDFINKIPTKTIILSDPQRLKIIFQNIISNGIKYADFDKPNSFIKIECTKQNNVLWLTISDNGIGISDENIDKVFNMYFRATQRSDGSGLGLFIVKEIVNKLSGEISVKSILNQETAFVIQLPLDLVWPKWNMDSNI